MSAARTTTGKSTSKPAAKSVAPAKKAVAPRPVAKKAANAKTLTRTPDDDPASANTVIRSEGSDVPAQVSAPQIPPAPAAVSVPSTPLPPGPPAQFGVAPEVATVWEKPAARPDSRPVWKKKRVLIPAGIFALLVVAGVAGSDETSSVGTAAGSDVRVEEKAPVDSTTESTEKAAAEKAAAEKAAAETAGLENAREAAESYLSMTAFSRSGLINQLKYEGYSTEDATYGVDSQHANWNTQAAKAAESYLEMTSFSRSGLIQQLMYEGYTRSQAEYGVAQTGL